MIPKTRVSSIACAPGALPGGPVRTRFFDGMFLTQADLETEQRFWRLKRRLTNRALGEGVVWGLRLAWNPTRHSFQLSQGYALDCCGNDLIVECPVEISEADLWSRADPALKNRLDGLVPGSHRGLDVVAAVDHAQRPKTRSACVVLQYTECAEDVRPVHRDACAAPTTNCEPARVRETARLLLVPPPTPRPTPPEKFLEELETWRDSLPTEVRNALFPPQGTPTTAPTSGLVPLHVRVGIPGTPAASVDLQPPTSGSTTPAALVATQTPASDRRTGVVTFELRPSTGWGFTAGTVFDQTRVVATVTPPIAPSMFWPFEVAIPDGASTAEATFEFRVAQLDVAELFGGTRRGRVDLRISGIVRVDAEPQTNAIRVRVGRLIVTTDRAEVAQGGDEQGCLRELVPWGWTVDPGNGRALAGTLVLSSVHAFLSEVVRRGGSPAWQRIAVLAYTVTWYALFGAFPLAKVPDAERKKLAELILALYKRWCEGLAYPGPRCGDEHHGVYLGCAELDTSGRIVAFDMWEHRRYVVTGALLEHWARQVGIAPLDVIVGRFAKAMCCLSGLPGLVLPPFDGRLSPGIGGENPDGRFHVGTAGSTADFAKSHGAELRWVSHGELARRAPEAFVRRDEQRVEVLASQIEGGGSIAIAVPHATSDATDSKLREDVIALLRRGELRTRERGRPAVTDFVVALAHASPPTAMLGNDVPEATSTLAKRLAKSGATLATLLDSGADGVLVQIGEASPEMSAAADDLVDRAETSVDAIVEVTVKTLGPKLDRASFGSADAQRKLAEAIASSALPELPADAVRAAANLVARA